MSQRETPPRSARANSRPEERPGGGRHQELEPHLVDRAERLLLIREQPVEDAAVNAREPDDLRDRRGGVAVFLHDLGGGEHDPLTVVFGDGLLSQPRTAGRQCVRGA